MKIAIIGPKDSCDKISAVIKKYYSDLIPIIYPVSKIEKAYLEVKEIEKICSAIIFSGIAVKTKVEENIKINLPHIFIPHLTASVLKALWEQNIKFPNSKTIIMDSVEPSDVSDLIDELNIKEMKIHIKPYSVTNKEEEYLNYHEVFHLKDKNVVSIVGLGWVYEELKKKKRKVVRLYPIISTIKESIKELMHKLDILNIVESTIGVQILKIKSEINLDQYRLMEIKSKIEHEIINYLKEVQGSIFNVGWDKYIIYTTKGALHNNENTIYLRKILKKLEKNKIILAIGNGYGKTAYESEINAKKALKESLKEDRSSIYELDNKKLKGPLLSYEELEYEYIIANEEIKKISTELKINPLYLKKIEALIKKYSKNSFTCEELSNHLDISIRSGNRLIKKIVDSGYGEKTLVEMTNTVGRPREIVDFFLDKIVKKQIN
ncbi:MAG: hypothetical protein ACRC6K_05750 [Fusobacteriaceae bacterium]